METRRVVLAATVALALSASSATAASYTCGVTMCRIVGIPHAQCKKLGLALALQWAKRFPRVSAPAPSVVVVQARRGRALGGGAGGHVSKIVEVTDHCRAIVVDNRGRYERNICKNLVAYVMPSGFATADTGAFR